MMENADFIDFLLYLLQRGIQPNSSTSSERPINYVPPENLEKELSLTLGEGHSLDQMIGICQQAFYYSVNTQSKFFANQLYGGADPYAILADALTSYFNTSMATYEISPVFTMMEREIVHRTSQIFGFPASSQGIFCPGGSTSNLYALHLARTKFNPILNQAGMYVSTPLKVFCSQQAHYSIKKSMMLAGLGTFHLITVPCDEQGRLIPEKLEQAIKNHSPRPLMVVGTAGTTVFGAFDPFEAIAKIAKKYGLWFHIDAALGGSVAFSAEHKHLLKGIELADSLSWDPHKMLRIPQQCSLFLTRHESLLRQAFSAEANYLFQTDKPYDSSYDLGPLSFQCGRRPDSLKLWLPWKIYGDQGWSEQIDHNFRMTQLFVQKVKNHPKFRLVQDSPQLTNVCFWYWPQASNNQPALTYGQLHTIAPLIKKKLLLSGRLMINYQPQGDLPNFFRMVFVNPNLSPADLDQILTMIAEAGDQVLLEHDSKSLS